MKVCFPSETNRKGSGKFPLYPRLRIGSRFGLEALVQPRTVCVDRSRGKKEMWWYPYGDNLVDMARGLVELTRPGGARLSGARMAVGGLLNRWK